MYEHDTESVQGSVTTSYKRVLDTAEWRLRSEDGHLKVVGTEEECRAYPHDEGDYLERKYEVAGYEWRRELWAKRGQ